MTLYELGAEYVEQSVKIREQIKELRPKLKTLSGSELLDLRRNLASLYQMSLDCRKIGEHLQTYYS